MRGIEQMMHEGAESREITRLRSENVVLRRRLHAAIARKIRGAVLTDQQMLAVYAAARFVQDAGLARHPKVCSHMGEVYGRRWPVPLRRGLAVMSGVIASAKYLGKGNAK